MFNRKLIKLLKCLDYYYNNDLGSIILSGLKICTFNCGGYHIYFLSNCDSIFTSDLGWSKIIPKEIRNNIIDILCVHVEKFPKPEIKNPKDVFKGQIKINMQKWQNEYVKK